MIVGIKIRHNKRYIDFCGGFPLVGRVWEPEGECWGLIANNLKLMLIDYNKTGVETALARREG